VRFLNSRLPSILLTTLLVVLVISPITGAIVESIDVPRVASSRAFVSPVLLSDEYWVHGAYVEDPAFLMFNEPREGFELVDDVATGRVLVVLAKDAPATVLKGRVLGLYAVLPTHIYNIAYALISREQLGLLANTPGVIAILPDVRLDALINKEYASLARIVEERLEEPLQATSTSGGVYHYTVNITGAINVWLEYGIRGGNVTIAIIDTGVDYGSPGLGLEAIARDERGLPLVFDASSLGLVLTPVAANVTPDRYITVDPAGLYVFYPPYYVFRWNASLWVRVRGCRTFDGWLPFPEGNRWFVGNITAYGPVKFGLMIQYISVSVGGVSTTIYYTVPVILVDSNGDGLYDTLYVDTTTALYLLRWALGPAPCSVTIPGTLGATPDFSFADEVPIRYGNEVIARDLDGDGLNDYSIGTLAGYVYDAAYAIILEKLGNWKRLMPGLPPLSGYSTADVLAREVWSAEPVALIWPGLDPRGDYVVIEYDYHSHGTFCATTAAGRDYYAETGYGVRSIAGQAPATKIAASPALYLGTVAVSVYFFTGFDLTTPYGEGSISLWPTLLTNPWIAFEGWTWKWTYTGMHQVDITSNSYGISGWALWGWNSGMDPESLLFDYTTLVSGTAHFIAVGNGGPGYGTIASPAASTLSISVGAATEFTYRPLYGYAWPGSSRQVISWSNRGPTELGVVKPDVVAVGAFAWAVGRTWQALGARTLNGRLVHALFSGTSQATPMAAGVGALVVSAYKAKYGSRMPPQLLKTTLMNTARDMGFDELSQGAGFVDAYRAVTAVLREDYPRVYSTSILGDVLSELEASYTSITHGERLVGEWFEPKIYIPLVPPRGAVSRQLVIEGSGTYRAYAVRLERTEMVNFCDTVKRVIEPTIIVSCTGDTVVLNVTAATVYGHVVVDLEALKRYDYFEIELVYPFEYFEIGGRLGVYNNTISTSIVELAYWIDVGADDRFSWFETARIMYDIRGANALRIQIGDLEGQIKEIEHLARTYIGVDPTTLPRHLVVRIGVSGATYRGLLPIKARVSGYMYKPWSEVFVTPGALTVLKGGRGVVSVIVRGPTNPGFYSGYVVVEEATRGIKMLTPISFFVPIEIREEAPRTISPFIEATTRRNTYLRGAFDYTWRYESGDWRVFKVVIYPSARLLWALGVRVTWPVVDSNYASNVDVHVYGPYRYYMVDEESGRVYEYSVNGVQLAAELSRDPRGGSGYNPTRFWDTIGPGESLIVVPIQTYGAYRVVVRNIQFSGRDYEEPFTLDLLPVLSRVDWTYNGLIRGFEFTIEVTTSDPRLLPATVIPSDMATVATGPRELYHVNLTLYNFTVYVKSVEITETTFKASLVIIPPDKAPRGIYTVAVGALMNTPITTVGWYDRGSRVVYFEWYIAPVYLTFTYR
jgi:subtilisin family serine protease